MSKSVKKLSTTAMFLQTLSTIGNYCISIQNIILVNRYQGTILAIGNNLNHLFI